MKILYDSQIFALQRFGGVSRYFNELLFNKYNYYETFFSCRYSANEYLRETEYYRPINLLNSKYGKFLLNEINKKYTKKDFEKQNYDILHATYYDDYFLKSNKKPVIIDAHDMITELFPRKTLVQKILIQKKYNIFKNADAILAVSENTKKDLLKIYPDIPENKIFVCYRGSFWKLADEKEKKDYILYTGQRNYYKNFKSFLIAVSVLLKKHNIKLICTASEFSVEECKLINELGINEYVEHRFSNDKELHDLYEHALCFVYPSLYEGFGLPILEAWSSCCPLVLSNASCFPEIAKEAGFYFDPNSIDDMRNSIEMVITNTKIQKELIENGKKRLLNFQWKDKIEETSNIYKLILEK